MLVLAAPDFTERASLLVFIFLQNRVSGSWTLTPHLDSDTR
jgi:hypothetical protein